jgi:DNA gyrase/topoisomerase IV subunit B
MEKTTLEMMYELVEIDSVTEEGYRNCVDISVDSDDRTFLLANGIVSHNSALGGLLPSLGRKEKAYYMLKGKPLNAYSASQKKFIENKELSGLYQIIKNGVTFEDKPDGDFYKINIDGQEMIVNENDEIKIDNKWVLVKDLL